MELIFFVKYKVECFFADLRKLILFLFQKVLQEKKIDLGEIEKDVLGTDKEQKPP